MALVSLSFSPVPAQVRTARMLAAVLARRCGLPDDLVDEVRLAVGEACSRAIVVQTRVDPPAEVRVRFLDDNRGYEVSVDDDGPADAVVAQDPGPLLDEDLVDVLESDELAGALSLALVRGLVDDVDVHASATGGTTVVLRWKR